MRGRIRGKRVGLLAVVGALALGTVLVGRRPPLHRARIRPPGLRTWHFSSRSRPVIQNQHRASGP